MDSLLWAFALLGVGVLFLVMEVFLPSGGVLAFFSGCSMIAGIVIGFTGGFRPGMIVTLVTLIVLPASVAFAIKYWPKTPIGRLMVAPPPDLDGDGKQELQKRERDSLVGRIGMATTTMLPSGEVTIDGQPFNAVTSGMAVEPGQVVEVIDVKANRIVVKPTSRSLENEGPDLAQSFEDLGLDSLEDA